MEEVQNVGLKNISSNIPLKFEKICRLCLSNLEIKPLFKLHFEGLLLFEIYQEITLLQVAKGDRLPEHICMACIEKIVCTFVFIQSCQKTDQLLRSQIENSTNKENIIKQEINDPETITKDQLIASHHKLDLNINITSEAVIPQNETITTTIIKDKLLIKNESTDDNDVGINPNMVQFNITNCSTLDSSKSDHQVKTNPAQNTSDLKFNKICRVIEELPKLIGPPFTCNICSRSYDDLLDFKRHYKKSTMCLPRIHACNHCNRRFTRRYKLQLHMRTHTQEKPYQCSICDEKFGYIQNFQRHQRRHTEEKPYGCDLCSKRFTRSTGKIEHMRLHTGELPFLCAHCGKGFSSSTGLKLHTINHELENKEQGKQDNEVAKTFLCSKCPRKYVRKMMLVQHEKSHCEEKENPRIEEKKLKIFLCSICGKRYATSAQLSSHTTVHSKIKSHHCKFCNKAFCYKSSLKSHLLLHTGERPHICSVCNKTFVQKNHLTQHIGTHTKEKPFACNFCGKCFALKRNFNIHIRQHTGQTPQCSGCNRQFYDKRNLEKHLKRFKCNVK